MNIHILIAPADLTRLKQMAL